MLEYSKLSFDIRLDPRVSRMGVAPGYPEMEWCGESAATPVVWKDSGERGAIRVWPKGREGVMNDKNEKAAGGNGSLKEQYRLVVENATDVIVVAREGRLVFANRAAVRFTGRPPEDLIGMEFLQVVHPEDREKVLAIHRDRVAGRPVPERYDLRVANAEGEPRCGELRGRTIEWEGKPAVLAFIRDVTEQKEAEKRRTELEDQLRQAQKMEAIGQLAGGVAHDFNNTLAGIIIFTELLHRNMDEKDPGREDVTQIREAARRAQGLTRKLLAFGRRQILEMHTLDLNAVFTDLRDMMKRTLPESIEISWATWDRPLLFEGDKGQVEQVLLNLAVNARDAMPDGGQLWIETAPEWIDEDFVARNAGFGIGHHVRLSVIDDGKGMDEKTRERIFDPFFTTKQAGEGTGLGLSTVYGIVKQHGGEIVVSSARGKGSRFDIYFPATKGRASVPRMRDDESALPTGDETILVVEDNPLVRLSTCKVLRRFGYKVLDAASGPEALELIDGEAKGERIDLLLTDVVMPVMNGREVHEAFLRRRLDIRVLFMSGYTGNIIAKHGVLERGTHFIEKPFSIAELAHKVREAIEEPAQEG